jgi:hypothetical protein
MRQVMARHVRVGRQQVGRGVAGWHGEECTGLGRGSMSGAVLGRQPKSCARWGTR